MIIKLKVVMASGEIYNYYFENLHDTAVFANDFDEFLFNHSTVINDSLESMSVVVSDGITELSIVW